MAVYDKEKEKLDQHKEPGSHDDLGIHSERKEAEVADLEKMYAKEPAKQKDDSASGEKEALGVEDDSGGGFFKDDAKEKSGRLRGKLTRKKVLIGGGIAGIFTGGVIGFLLFSSGPLQFIHFAQLLQGFHFSVGDNVTEGRLGNMYRYLRFRNNPEMRRLGTLQQKIATKTEAKFEKLGIDVEYENGRMRSVSFDGDDLAKFRSAGLELDVTDAGNGRFTADIDPPGTNASTARTRIKHLSKVSKALDVKVGVVGTRTLLAKADVKLFQLSPRRTVQNVRAKFDAWREKSKSYIEDGKIQDIEVRTSETDIDNSSSGAETETDTTRTGGGKTTTRATLNRVAGGIAGLGLVCGAYSIADSASELRTANVVLPLMRTGMRIMSIGSQVQAGDVDIDELGFVAQELYDRDAPAEGASWASARSIQGEQGKPLSGPDIPNSAHPTNAGNFILEWFRNNITGGLRGGISSVCGAVNSLPGQAAGYAVDFFTGGTTALAKEAAADLIFSQFSDDLVNLLAGEEVSGDVKGAELGNFANYGARLAANERMISFGGRELNDTDVALLDAENDKLQQEEHAQKSLFAKVFDVYDTKSVASNVMLSAPRTIPQAASMLANAPGTILSNITGRATAQQEQYSYGFNEFGFSLQELNDERYQNPFANAERVGPLLSDSNIKERIEKCFGMTVESDGSITPKAEAVRVIDDDTRSDANCNDTSEQFTRVRFYVLDTLVGESAACYDGDQESCRKIGFEGTAGSSEGSGNPNLYMIGDSLSTPLREGGSSDIVAKFKGNGWQDVCVEAEESRPLGASELTQSQAEQSEPPIDCRGNEGQKKKGLLQIEQSPDREAIAAAGTAVIALGTNDGPSASTIFRDNATSMIDKLRAINPQIRIYWVNLFLKNDSTGGGRYLVSDFDEMNRILGELSSEKNFEIIDWNSVAAPYYQNSADGIHPFGEYDAYADFIVNAVGPPQTSSTAEGNATELAQRILESGRVTGNSDYMAQIEAVAQGDNTCNVNVEVLRLLATLSGSFDFYITSLNRACTNTLTASGESSYHYRDGGGHAVDIGTVNGVSSTGGTAEDLALINAALPLLKSGSGIGQVNCRGAPLSLPEGVREFDDTCNHIHFQVPVQ